MRGIMWRLDAEARREAARARNANRKASQGSVKAVVVETADWHARHFGNRAGYVGATKNCRSSNPK